MMPIVNNFKLIKKSHNSPPYLTKYKEILGYQVYQSEFNALIYVVFDNGENIYYSFQYNGEFDNIDKDLSEVIKNNIIIKTL
jgi:hypothetical protein